MNAMPPGQDAPKFIRSHGLKFPYNPDIITGRIRRLLHKDGYEKKEFEAIRALISPEDTVLELGAGIGFMSTAAAKLCGAKSVATFEANPSLVPYIRSVHDANGVKNVTVHNALLAPRKSNPVDFYVRKNLLASSMEPMQGDKDGGVVSVEKVEVQNINTVLKDLAPSVLICDIEGGEAALLPGAKLDCLRLAIVELHPQWIGQSGVQKVFDTMHSAGLTYFPKRSNGKVVTFRKGW